MRASGAFAAPRAGLEERARLARFIELTERYDRDVRAMCRRWRIHFGDIDDVVQRVFITVYAKLDRIEPEAERAFVMAVARRHVGHVRRTYARRAEVDNVALDRRSSGGVMLDVLLHQQRRLADADRALRQMPVDLSSAWTLHELDVLSCARIASTLDLPLGTVKTRLRRAREWLALALSSVPRW